MPKISELPVYDPALTDPDDFFPIVQDDQTKRLTLQAISEAKVIHTGNVSQNPTRAQLEAIFGTPDVDASFILRDTIGTQEHHIVVYNADQDTWWSTRMREAT